MLVGSVILEGVRKRNRDSWQTLAAAVRRSLWRQTAKRIPESEAEDLLQDVIVRLLLHIDEIQDAGHLENFVRRVWRQRIVDWYRKRRATPQTSSAARRLTHRGREAAMTIRGVLTRESDPETSVLLAELRDHVERSVALSGPQKQILQLHIFDGLTFRRIASELRAKKSSVQTLYFRGIERLRTEMALSAYRESPQRFRSSLSVRQRRALECLITGMSNRETANGLGLRVPQLSKLLAPVYEFLGRGVAREWQGLLNSRREFESIAAPIS